MEEVHRGHQACHWNNGQGQGLPVPSLKHSDLELPAGCGRMSSFVVMVVLSELLIIWVVKLLQTFAMTMGMGVV